MGSKPKPGGGAPQRQAAPTGPPGGISTTGLPLVQGAMPPPAPPAAPGGMDKSQILRMILEQAQTPAMGYNPRHGMFGGGGNPGQR